MSAQWSARPRLRRPTLVAAFEGWNDAGDAASGAIRWLARTYDAEAFASLEPDDWFDFQASRPQVTIADGVVRRLVWPRTRFLAATVEGGESDLVLLLGVEPNLRWPAFCATVIDVAREVGCEQVVTLGALLADVPHTRPTRVVGVADDPQTMSRLRLVGSTYEGPTGIVGVLHGACRTAGLRSVSLWAPVPHYVATAPNPKGTHALLERLRALLSLPADLHDLEVAARAWQQQIDSVAAGDAEIGGYVHNLEARYDAEAEQAEEPEIIRGDDLPTGETLAADIERFLREQGDDEP